ncbi:MAG: hypothetical protein LBR26_13185 [Prevotella sp.]|jgi:DNA polymerase-3 subunit epsilon|nr:hypothetical protein [Prevotella sp.]
MENVNFTAFDFETAYGQKNACQLGVVVVKKGHIVEEKSFLIRPPENKISKYCQQIHGINPAMTKSAPAFDTLWPDIKQYFERQVIVHHSDGFDTRILNQEFDFYNIPPCRFVAVESTMLLFDNKYSRSLANLCMAYGIEMTHHHDAASDARCCAEIFLRYLKGEEPDYAVLPGKKNGVYPDDPTGYKPRASFNIKNDASRIVKPDTKVQDLGIVTNRDTVFYDRKVVVSGVFERYPIRNDLGVFLKNLGADINGSISSRTDIFVTGKDSGPKKTEKVLELKDQGYNIRIIEESQLYKILDEINHG